MGEVRGGKKYGWMREVEGVGLKVKKREIWEMEKIGVIGMVKE